MEVMHGGWQSHIPLTALLSKPLLSSSDRDPSAAVPKLGRAISLMATLEDKDKPFMVMVDWLQAWPRLIDVVSNFLSSPQKLEIARLWELHFLRIWHQDDFVSNFHLLLHYDIRVRKSYTNCDLNFDPSEWQQGVWDQVLNAAHSAQLNSF